MSTPDYQQQLQRQMDAIQERRNFAPDVGAKQLSADLDQRADYMALYNLIHEAKSQGYDVWIPYDPLGLDPLNKQRIPLDQVRMGPLRPPTKTGPRPPRKGTFARTQWVVGNLHAQHPDLTTTNLLWAAKRVGVEDQTLLIETARKRPLKPV